VTGTRPHPREEEDFELSVSRLWISHGAASRPSAPLAVRQHVSNYVFDSITEIGIRSSTSGMPVRRGDARLPNERGAIAAAGRLHAALDRTRLVFDLLDQDAE
jgi:hypothetical protein